MNPYEVVQALEKAREQEIFAASPFRTEHVWVALFGADGFRWAPGVLSKWRSTPRGWEGWVAYVTRGWFPGTSTKAAAAWASIERDWVPALRLVRLDGAEPPHDPPADEAGGLEIVDRLNGIRRERPEEPY